MVDLLSVDRQQMRYSPLPGLHTLPDASQHSSVLSPVWHISASKQREER